MTREEAKEYIYECLDHDEAAEVIKALEQEPCEDCVSRRAVLEYQQYLHGKMSNEENHKLWEFIKDLPPVTPTRKKGKWVNDPYEDFLPHCSNCDSAWSYAENMNFCPNCGAEMESDK